MRSSNTIFLILAVLIVSISHATSYILKCTLNHDGWDFSVSNAYICKSVSANITSKVRITNIEGQHKTPYGNHHVTALLIRDQTCEFFPSGLENFFTKLEGIAVQNSNLKVIRKSDLKPFVDLKSLSVSQNKLASIEYRLFEFNRKLQIFSAFSNEIGFIGENFLDGLDDLKEVHLESNKCIDKGVKGDVEVAELKEVVKKNCPATLDMMALYDLENELKHLKMNLKDQGQPAEYPCDSKYQKLEEIVMKFGIECDEFYDSTCSANDVIIQYEGMSPKNVMENETEIDSKAIEQLEMQGKNIHFMPRNFGNFFVSLKNLTLTASKVTKIDENSLENLANLTNLSLNSNKIQEIHENAFRDLKSCVFIDLSDNRLTKVPTTISYVLKLVELNLENNQISTLNWKNFENLVEIQILQLNGNKIVQIGSNLLERRWQLLDLSDNECVDKKYPDESLDYLTQIFMENCTVEIEIKCKYSDENKDLKCSGVDIDISSENTKISRVISFDSTTSKSPKDVTKFSVVNQNLEFLPQNLQNFFPKLSKIEIISSNLKKISSLKHIEWMKITGNELTTLDNLNDMLLITLIDLSDNKIREIPQSMFSGLNNLAYLKLDGNFLTSIGDDFVPEKNAIEEIYVNKNLLSKISNKFVKSLKGAKIIEFNGNSCVDNKFNRDADNPKKYMELYGEIDLHC